MAGKKQEKAIAKVLDSPEMTRMIDMSLGEIDRLTSKLVEGGVSEQTARDEIENMYVRNLKLADEPLLLAKHNVASLMTRLRLEEIANPTGVLLDDKYLKILDMSNKLLKTVNSMEKRNLPVGTQFRDDNMIEGEWKE